MLDAIEAHYGIDPQVMCEDVPQDSRGFAVVAWHMWENIQYWQRYGVGELSNDDAPYVLDELFVPSLNALVEVAKRKKRGVALLMSLEKWIESAIKEFGLEALWREAGTSSHYITRARTQYGAPHPVHLFKSSKWLDRATRYLHEPNHRGGRLARTPPSEGLPEHIQALWDSIAASTTTPPKSSEERSRKPRIAVSVPKKQRQR
jgi:hypothetical protein